jgi:hypothetical protein
MMIPFAWDVIIFCRTWGRRFQGGLMYRYEAPFNPLFETVEP